MLHPSEYAGPCEEPVDSREAIAGSEILQWVAHP
jgi:hypothetical protein